MIDYNDPAQTMHNGEPIPINTPAKYVAGLTVVTDIYAAYELPWTQAEADQYDDRVRQGQTMLEVIVNTTEECRDRSAA